MNRRHLLLSLAPALISSVHSAESKKKFSVGIIGHTGRGNYGHGLDTMWLNIPSTTISAIADPDEKTLGAQLKKLKAPYGFADYEQMLSDIRPDIVAIGPRHVDQHRDMLLAAIRSGAKGVYIEKPFVRSPAEADEVVAAAEKTGTKIAVAHRNRYHPVLPVVAKLIEEGAIGRVLEMRGRGKEDSRGGALDLWVLGSHIFNLATFFGGAPKTCSATVWTDGKPVTRADVKEGDEGIGPLAGNEVHARFEMARSMPLFFDSVQNAGDRQAGFGLQIIGTGGIIDFRIDKEPIAHILAGNPFNPADAEPKRWLPVTTAGVDQQEAIPSLGRILSSHEAAGLDLVTAICENRNPLCDAAQGRETIEMICAVLESHRLGGKRTSLPLQTRVNPLTIL